MKRVIIYILTVGRNARVLFFLCYLFVCVLIEKKLPISNMSERVFVQPWHSLIRNTEQNKKNNKEKLLPKRRS